jgi:molybdate transport system substrate-binding protein
VPLGIVYETDAKIEPAVKVIGVFPDDNHDPIIYPVALRANAKPEAAQYLSFLRTQTAKSVFEKYGFNFLPTS